MLQRAVQVHVTRQCAWNLTPRALALRSFGEVHAIDPTIINPTPFEIWR